MEGTGTWAVASLVTSRSLRARSPVKGPLELITAGINGWFCTGWKHCCPGRSTAGAVAVYPAGSWPRKGGGGRLARQALVSATARARGVKAKMWLRMQEFEVTQCLESSGALRSGDADSAARSSPWFNFVCLRRCCVIAKMGCLFPLAQGEQAAAAPRSETPRSRGCCPGRGDPRHLSGMEHPSSVPFFLAIAVFSTGLRKSVYFPAFFSPHEHEGTFCPCWWQGCFLFRAETGRWIQAGPCRRVVASELMGAETEERRYVIWTAMQKRSLNF